MLTADSFFMRKYRIFSQILFLFIFVYLFLKTTYDKNNLIAYPVKAFLDLDPFIFISTLFSLHGKLWLIPPALFLSLLTMLITLLLGRIFCGWMCPFGAINQWIGALKKSSKFKVQSSKSDLFSYRFKYYLLFFLLLSSLFTLQLSGVFDPLSLFVRSLSISIYPAFQYALFSFYDTFNTFNSQWLNSIFPLNQLVYSQSMLIAMVLITVLVLNLYRKRFFCRYLCPLGACLGIFSTLSPVRVEIGDGCNTCGKCLNDCQGGIDADKESGWRKSECLLCGNCMESCKVKAIHMNIFRSIPQREQLPDLKRRHVFTSIASGIMAVPLLRISPAERTVHPELIRPPGSLEESEFLKRCVKCGECMKVCLTNGLQPTLFEAGPEGIWSPKLVSRIGYCAYNCTLCGQVCPTNAIRKLSMAEKARIKIGLAFIDQGRCLPYAFGKNCIVCEEHCPTPKKAIWFQEKEMVNREGARIMIKQPVVDPELCIGCGICEFKCPVKDRPAIRVTSAGETRSEANQPFLL